MDKQKYTIKVPRAEKKIIDEYMVDEDFLLGLGRLEDLKTHEQVLVKSILNEVSIKTGGVSGLEPLNQLFDYVKNKIVNGETGRDRHLPKKLEEIISLSEEVPPYIKHYSPQWVKDTDFSHTIASLIYTDDICERLHLEDRFKKIVMSAMIVHDCAYPKVNSYEEFTSIENRTKHMKNAVEEFQKWAVEINKNFKRKRGKEYYTEEDIEQVCKIVSQHDNPGIGIDFDYSGLDERLFFIHREADRIWMLDKAGFALDLLREIVEKSRYNPKARLEYVIKDHQEESKIYKQFSDKCQMYDNKPTIYREWVGFDFFTKLIEDRKRDYQI